MTDFESDSKEQAPHPASAQSPSAAPAAWPASFASSTWLVLRAAAVLGSPFDVSRLAKGIGLTELEVLWELQRAQDAGIGLDDFGHGSIALPPSIEAALRDSTIPSLAAAWRAAVGLESPENLTSQPPESTVETESHAIAAESTPPPQASGVPEPSESEAEAQMFDPSDLPPHPERHSEPLAQIAARRAAEGNLDEAAHAFVEAAEAAAREGAAQQAVDYARNGLGLLEGLADFVPRRELRVRALLGLARIQWKNAGPGPDFTLEGALATAYEAEALARELPIPLQLADSLAVMAGILYDVGDPESLDQAISALTNAIRMLQQSGHPVEAAGLLSEQALVWVRAGDPVRAHHLVQKARAVFEARSLEDPRARLELAKTELLLARLPLHVAARPGRERDAVDLAISHAESAERAFAELGTERERARAWETLGRLCRLAERPDDAERWLLQAVSLQQRLGDVLALACSAEALAELFADRGRWSDAVALLGDSLQLNYEKGSHQGLMYLQASVAALRNAVPPELRNQLAARLDGLQHQLARARAEFLS